MTETSGKGSRKKNTAAKKPSSAGKKTNQKQREKESSFIGTEVAMLVTLAVSVLLFLSNFGLCGSVGGFLRSVMLGLFGFVGYAAPVLLMLGVAFHLSNRGNIRAAVKMAAVGVVLAALCGLCQMLLGGGVREGFKLTDYYVQAAADGGGGLVGGILVCLLSGALGTAGTYVVLAVFIAVGAVFITEKSLISFVKRGSGRAYQYAKKDMSRRKEAHEEKKKLREEQRVRGVDLQSANLSDVPLMREFASGIPEGTVLSGDPLQEKTEEKPAPLPDLDGPESGETLQKAAEGIPPLTEAVNPADLFRGSIHRPSEPLTDAEEAEQKEEVKPEREEPEDRLLKSIYVRRDTRTLEEIASPDETAGQRVGYTDLSVQEPEEPSQPWNFEEEEPETGDTGIFDDEAYLNEVEPDRSGFYEFEEEKAAPEETVFSAPEGTRTVVTASGKVIETDTEAVHKLTESRRKAEAQAEKRKEEPQKEELTVSQEIDRKNFPEEKQKKEYVFPPLTLLKKSDGKQGGLSDREYRETAIKLQQTLQNFGVGVTVTNISCGPSVTRYELHPEQGVKVSRIVALADDIKLNLAAADIRIEAPIPGKAAVGIEVPNKENQMVLLRDLLESPEFRRHKSKVAFAVGKDIAGQTVVSDIAKMPHLLIAGATGSGKSVCINTLIMSVIYKARPEEVRLIMIDPKVVELSVYNGIPHLLIPVVTDPKKASGALNWAVAEMTDRYQKFAAMNVRDLKGYNEKIEQAFDEDDEKRPEKLPQIIIIVDELADLMMVAPGEVEDSICRLAQLARAAGIHLVIATQRPSVNIITGVIKANIPSRIAFSVSSGVDSRTIIDMNGAEKLLGKGDMLFYPAGYQKPQRVQGAFVSDQEVSAVVEFLTKQGITADYSSEIETKISSQMAAETAPGGGERDDYFLQAGRFIIEKDKASIGMLQRMFKIGFNRAARIMDQLADAGVVGEEEGTRPRKILMTMEEFENTIEQGE